MRRRELIRANGGHAPRKAMSLIAATALLAAGVCATASGQTDACSYCPPLQFAPGDPVPLYVQSTAMGIVCQPARIACDEGAWTFFLRGPGILSVTAARLKVGSAQFVAARLTMPTPRGLLIDFKLPALAEGAQADLILLNGNKEFGRLPIAISGPASVPVGHRQPDFVRLQLREWTLHYPLQPAGATPLKLEEIGGDEDLRARMQEMDIRGVRKIMSSIVEGDTVQWDERNHRENVYGAKQLRMYLMYVDPGRSQEAYREIFRAYPQVEQAWVNEDADLLRRKKYGK